MGNGHMLFFKGRFAVLLCVECLRRVTFSHARESNQRARIGAAAPMYPRGFLKKMAVWGRRMRPGLIGPYFCCRPYVGTVDWAGPTVKRL